MRDLREQESEEAWNGWDVDNIRDGLILSTGIA
jgi:hypothetical protein